jgi:hypothetical protein
LHDFQSQLNKNLEKKKIKIDIWPNISNNFFFIVKEIEKLKVKMNKKINS